MLSDLVKEKFFAKKEIQQLDLMTVYLVTSAIDEAMEEVDEEEAVKQSSIYEKKYGNKLFWKIISRWL